MRARSSLHGWLGAVLALPLAGCALERGNGFSTLEAAELEVRLAPVAAGEGTEHDVLSDQGYEVHLESARLHVDRVELQELVEDEAAEDEHEHEHEHDHDHAGDEHEARGSGALVTLGFGAAISLFAAEPALADSYLPSRELAQSSPGRVLVVLSRLELDGTVGAGDFGDGSASLVVDLPLDIELDASLEPIEIDRDGPESLRLSTTLEVDRTLFDGIDFAALEAGGDVVIDDPEAAAALGLSASLAGSAAHASLE
jgi:hypothetical protein